MSKDNLKPIMHEIDFNVLAKLCYTLNCDVADIIEYVPHQE